MNGPAALTKDRRDEVTAAPPRRLRGSTKIALLTAGLVAAAGSLFAFVVVDLPVPTGEIRSPLWVLVVMFALAEILVVHVEFRGNAYSFSLSELPFVIGLFTAAPVDLVAGHFLGSALALIVHRRQSALKLAFNLSHFALESCLALIVFNAFGAPDPSTPGAWLATLFATLTFALVADAAVETAVSLAEGKLETGGMLQRMAFGKVVSATNASIGLIGALILWVQPSAAWVLAAPTAILFFSYRVYTSQREQHTRMEFLYESTHLLNRSLKLEAALPALLSQAQTMFKADVAEILLFTHKGEPTMRTLVGPGDRKEILTPVKLDPTEGVWARIAAEGQPLLFTRPIQPAQLRKHFDEQGIRDAMVAPLRGTGGIVGTIMVGNRLGDVTTFDNNDLQMFE
ncbi:MAG: GAF domain-containing protein, partial [Actinomycetota bacterium]